MQVGQYWKRGETAERDQDFLPKGQGKIVIGTGKRKEEAKRKGGEIKERRLLFKVKLKKVET